ncbi:MAG: AAA family ATPase [Microthrixaceae bacterium]
MAEPEPAPLPDPAAEASELLSTKLHVPRLPSTFVPRGRLLDRLDERPPGGGLTSVCAPAGFGKSVVVAHWLDERWERAAWLSLDAGDNDVVRFWRHVAAALDGASDEPRGRVLDDVDEVVRDPQATPEALVTSIVNAMAARVDHLVLVLEDYHLITAEPVHASLRYLLDHAPPSLHVVVVSRADPPLQLARRRARGELTEIREAELRFTDEEADQLLHLATGGELPNGAASKLADRTEGWAVGLQLAGLSLRDRADVAEVVATFSGSHRFILDYLTEEVLDQQSPEVREFLLHTSILDRLSAPLCDAVTGRSDSQSMLEAIEHANLFLVPLDERRGWWRYHHLFADLLRARLLHEPAAEVRALHARASSWHDEHGLVSDAVHHALAAGDPEKAGRVIERHADEVLLRREGTTLQRWFEQLPASQLGSRRLLLAEARVALYRGQVGEAEALLDAADEADVDPEGRFEPSVDATASPLAALEPTAALLRAFVAHLRGDHDGSSALAAEALADVTGEKSAVALIAQLHLATAPWLRGEAEDAQRALAANIADWRAVRQPDRGLVLALPRRDPARFGGSGRRCGDLRADPGVGRRPGRLRCGGRRRRPCRPRRGRL